MRKWRTGAWSHLFNASQLEIAMFQVPQQPVQREETPPFFPQSHAVTLRTSQESRPKSGNWSQLLLFYEGSIRLSPPSLHKAASPSYQKI